MSQDRTVVGDYDGRGERLAQVQVTAQPYAELTGVPPRLLRVWLSPTVRRVSAGRPGGAFVGLGS
ncbi:hypothetical protein AB0I06_08425 [Streptomyces sp. NPDC050674]|uniref:hypothetical protein n=1 Tax=Streptomyces sp. NPDC050674 TaxID=3157216 RepID=UPI00342A8332